MEALPLEVAEGVRLRMEVEDVKEERVFAADERCEVIVVWLRSLGLGDTARELVEGKTLELIDATTYPGRRLVDWSATLQASGLWPSARLRVCPIATVEIKVRAAGRDDEASVHVRPSDDTIADLAAMGYAALPRALKNVAAKDAKKCRVVYEGRRLEPDCLISQSSLKNKATVFIVAPPPTTHEESNTGQRRACRICMEEETLEARRDLDVLIGERLRKMAGAYWRALNAKTSLRRSSALGEARNAWRGLVADCGPRNRLISPCRCKGTMRYVHLQCLNEWRSVAPTARSVFRCDQCGYEYRVQRAAVAACLASGQASLVFATFILSSAIFCAGELLYRCLSPLKRRRLYFWLRLSSRLANSRSKGMHVFLLGSSAVGLAVFSLYAFDQLLLTALYLRLGGRHHWWTASQPALLLFLWVAAETVDLRRARALAVVGFAVASRLVFTMTLSLATKLSTRFADRILDIGSSSPDTEGS